MDFFNLYDNQQEIPSRQAFTQAREKINFLAFKDFFEKSCELAIDAEEARLYKGFRLLAVDGTSFIVGAMAKLAKFFGKSTSIKDKAMCRLSAVVDVLNNSIVDTIVSPFSIGERALALEQAIKLSGISNALFIFDRGYWSPELVNTIITNGQKFIMRLASSAGKAIALDDNGKEHELRRCSFTLPSGELEMLLTNLTPEEVSDSELAALYAKRWGAETKFLELKDRLQVDSFSGESVNIVLQDIYATLYISNLVAFLCFESDEVIKARTADKGNKYKQRTNRSTCISALRQRFISICLLGNEALVSDALQRLCHDISRDVVYIGKSKSRPRDKRKIKDARLHAFKSLL